jgi:hypothetical protein
VLNGCIDRAEAKGGSEFSLIGRTEGVDLPKHSALYITHTFLSGCFGEKWRKTYLRDWPDEKTLFQSQLRLQDVGLFFFIGRT